MPDAGRQETIDGLVAQASTAHAGGRLDEAQRYAAEALSLDADNAQALLLLGVVQAKRSHFEEALSLLERVAAGDPTSFFARFWLSIVTRSLARYEDAVKWALEAVARKPSDAKAQNQLAVSYFDLKDYSNAVTSLEKAAQLAPQVWAIQMGLAKALQRLGRNREATEALRRAERLSPNQPEVLTELISIYNAEADTEQALRYARGLASAAPDSPAAQVTLARALIEANRPGEGLSHVAKALELAADDGANLAEVASIYQTLGRMDEALGMFERSAELLPRQGFAYFGIAQSRKIGEEDRRLLSTMANLASDPALSARHHMNLRYALGKGYDDLGDYQVALGHYDEANRLAYESKFGVAPFDDRALLASVDFVIRTFDRSFFARNRGGGSDSELPIFVVGMMRSGTTLTEQILSSHPEIGGAGEQRFWSDHRTDALLEHGVSVDAVRMPALSEQYLGLLEGIAPGNRRVVDKMPMNYSLLGVIHAAFPNARIVHVQRHPVDTCISIYTTPNRSRIEWANDRGNIVFAYRQYLRVMEHWRAALPPGSMLEVRYEDLVSDRERVTREMIEFCGLEWNEACLRPEDNQRSVVTPSMWQVRQPVYKTSMERWRRYEPWLGVFRDLLEPA